MKARSIVKAPPPRRLRYAGGVERAVVVLSTFGQREQALAVGRTLVDEGLAACVNVLGEVRSVYRWQGAVEEDNEVLCVIKTTAEGFERLRARLVALHPYEVPEVVALPVEAVHEPYLSWLTGVVRKKA
jgi:periplasmic divalent cation tolerance protein